MDMNLVFDNLMECNTQEGIQQLLLGFVDVGSMASCCVMIVLHHSFGEELHRYDKSSYHFDLCCFAGYQLVVFLLLALLM